MSNKVTQNYFLEARVIEYSILCYILTNLYLSVDLFAVLALYKVKIIYNETIWFYLNLYANQSIEVDSTTHLPVYNPCSNCKSESN